MKSKAYERIHKWLGGFVRFIFRIRVHGAENEPREQDGAYLMISNHISNIDPIVLCAATKEQQPNFMAKKELFKVPVLRKIVKALGAFPVDRGGADVGAIKKAIKLLEDGYCVGIFPQGHRRKGVNPRTTEVKNGVAMLAVKSQAQILPCYIKTKKNKLAPFRRVDVYIGKPIKFDELEYNAEASGEYARIARLAFERVCDLGDCPKN